MPVSIGFRLPDHWLALSSASAGTTWAARHARRMRQLIAEPQVRVLRSRRLACGAWATKKPRLLCQPCGGQAARTDADTHALKQFKQGILPRADGEPLGRAAILESGR